MKKLILLIVVLFAVSQVADAKSKGRKSNRNQEFKGYYGLGLGASLPMGDFKGPDDAKILGKQVTGVHIALANAGYKLAGPVGICAQVFVGANRSDYTGNDFTKPVPAVEVSTKDKDSYWVYSGVLIGPLFSFDLSDFVIDIRPQYGLTYVATPELNTDITDGVLFKSSRNSGTGYDIGATFRYKYSEKGSIGLNLDYFGTKVDYQREINNVTTNMSQKINVLGVGIALVFAM
ncbi:MAG: hypothetical protein WCO63_01785 [Bacteroidota bacterium]